MESAGKEQVEKEQVGEVQRWLSSFGYLLRGQKRPENRRREARAV